MSETLRLAAFSILIGTFSFYLLVFRMEIIDFLEDQLVQKIKAMFASAKDKELYSIFYKYNHTSTEEWVAWIKSSNENIQNKALDRIKSHLSKEPKDSRLVVTELINALVLFEAPDAFDILEQHLFNARLKWLDSKIRTTCYERAALALMKLDDNKAQKLLIQEFGEIGDGQEDHRFKRYIIDSLALVKNKADLYQFFLSIVFDDNHPADVKIQTLNILEKSDDQSVYLDYLHELIDKFTVDVSSNDQLLSVCFARYMDSTSNETARLKAWKTIYEYSKDDTLASVVVNSLANKVMDKDFNVDNEWLFRIYMNLNDDLKTQLEESLSFCFSLNDQEQSILQSRNEFDKFLTKVGVDVKEHYSFIVTSGPFKLYKFVEDQYSNFSLAVEQTETAIKVITGSAALDKLFMAKEYAKEKHGKTMCINGDILMLSPDKVNDVDKVIAAEKPRLIYLYNCYDLIKTIANKPDNELGKNMFEFIKRHQLEQGTQLIVALDKDMKVLEADLPAAAELLKDGSKFKQVHEIGAIDHEYKRAIYEYYEIILRKEREAPQVVGLNKIAPYTEGMGCTSFLKYVLDFITSSILTHGKLIPLEDYDRLLSFDSSQELSEDINDVDMSIEEDSSRENEDVIIDHDHAGALVDDVGVSGGDSDELASQH